jgi:hypothetical protein
MPDLRDGDSVEMKGSATKPYSLKNVGGVYSCTCPAWRNQSIGIERRTCKHLRTYRGEQAEIERIGSALPTRPEPKTDDEALSPGLLLAQTWTNDVDLAGWWMRTGMSACRRRCRWSFRERVRPPSIVSSPPSDRAGLLGLQFPFQTAVGERRVWACASYVHSINS